MCTHRALLPPTPPHPTSPPAIIQPSPYKEEVAEAAAAAAASGSAQQAQGAPAGTQQPARPAHTHHRHHAGTSTRRKRRQRRRQPWARCSRARAPTWRSCWPRRSPLTARSTIGEGGWLSGEGCGTLAGRLQTTSTLGEGGGGGGSGRVMQGVRYYSNHIISIKLNTKKV